MLPQASHTPATSSSPKKSKPPSAATAPPPLQSAFSMESAGWDSLVKLTVVSPQAESFFSFYYGGCIEARRNKSQWRDDDCGGNGSGGIGRDQGVCYGYGAINYRALGRGENDGYLRRPDRARENQHCSHQLWVKGIPGPGKDIGISGDPGHSFGKRGAKVDFPGFYSRSSGLLSLNVVETLKEAASIICAHSPRPGYWEIKHKLIEYQTPAMLWASHQANSSATPSPPNLRSPNPLMADIISAAIKKAEKGKDNTPYILDRIKKDSKGRSIPANKALVLNNVQCTYPIPPEANESKMGFMPAISTHPVPSSPPEPSVSTPTAAAAAPTASPEAPFSAYGKTEFLTIGSVAVDYACDFLPTNLSGSPVPSLCTSNPSTITETIGGVAHVFTAADLYLRSLPWVLETLGKRKVDISGIAVRDAKREGVATARYIAINDAKGGLFTAAADMRVVERMSEEHVRAEIERWGHAGFVWTKDLCIVDNTHLGTLKVAFEPTSVQKSTRIFPELKSSGDSGPMLGVSRITRCISRRRTSMNSRRLIDDFNIDTLFRNSMEMLAEQAKLPLLVHGTLQQAIHLSPYLPTQLIKLGAHGVLAHFPALKVPEEEVSVLMGSGHFCGGGVGEDG
ncbi:hypothetical protein BDZ91DRAFT_786117 [Kalaharituber pfeilii]|nr:hypothetical protein BDZ91DRAFT_786117 [Kalaharituber pfeilii]